MSKAAQGRFDPAGMRGGLPQAHLPHRAYWLGATKSVFVLAADDIKALMLPGVLSDVQR